jgi:DNA repair exonuclease SbcCD ATPase subunit
VRTLEEELEAKIETVRKLQLQIGKLQGKVSQREQQLLSYREAVKSLKESREPMKRSLELMTAAHGKLLRKMKKQENTNGKR